MYMWLSDEMLKFKSWHKKLEKLCGLYTIFNSHDHSWAVFVSFHFYWNSLLLSGEQQQVLEVRENSDSHQAVRTHMNVLLICTAPHCFNLWKVYHQTGSSCLWTAELLSEKLVLCSKIGIQNVGQNTKPSNSPIRNSPMDRPSALHQLISGSVPFCLSLLFCKSTRTGIFPIFKKQFSYIES